MKPENEYFSLQGEKLALSGDWIVSNAENISNIWVKTAENSQITHIDASHVGKMDSWGAFYLKKIIEATGAQAQTTERQQTLLEFLSGQETVHPVSDKTPLLVSLFENIGEKSLHSRAEIYGILCFIGQTSLRFFKNIGNPKAFRIHSIVRHIDETGIRAVPIIALLAILTSMVISYQAATQLQKFGANIFTIDLTVISLLREMGVLITAIMVAGRSGSAFAAEIGVMKLREEVDALKTIGMDPFEVLVIPRVIALMITLPILTFVADMVGLLGGGIISMTLLDIPLDQYVERVQTVAKPMMFFVGMVKAPVFAFIIAIIGTYQGMNISGSAESVGKLTTISVVQSIFLVIMADALFSILFSQMGI